jgi:hypothetical protein
MIIMIEDGQPLNQDCVSIKIKELLDGKVADLKDIIDARFRSTEDKIAYQAKAAQIALDKAFETTQLAITKVEISTKSGFENTNEWRGTLKDQIATFATRAEIETLKEIVNSKMGKSEYDNRHVVLESKIDLVGTKFENYYTKPEINDALKTNADETRKVSDRQLGLLILVIAALIGVAFDLITRR